jgi:hypothetical protein
VSKYVDYASTGDRKPLLLIAHRQELRDELQIWQKPSAPDVRPVKLVHRSLTSSQADRLQHLEPLHDVDPHDIVMEHDNLKTFHTP